MWNCSILYPVYCILLLAITVYLAINIRVLTSPKVEGTLTSMWPWRPCAARFKNAHFAFQAMLFSTTARWTSSLSNALAGSYKICLHRALLEADRPRKMSRLRRRTRRLSLETRQTKLLSTILEPQLRALLSARGLQSWCCVREDASPLRAGQREGRRHQQRPTSNPNHPRIPLLAFLLQLLHTALT